MTTDIIQKLTAVAYLAERLQLLGTELQGLGYSLAVIDTNMRSPMQTPMKAPHEFHQLAGTAARLQAQIEHTLDEAKRLMFAAESASPKDPYVGGGFVTEIKQRLRKLLEEMNRGGTVTWKNADICVDALAEIERLETIRDRCHTGAKRVLQHGNKDPIGLYGAALRAIVNITSSASHETQART